MNIYLRWKIQFAWGKSVLCHYIKKEYYGYFYSFLAKAAINVGGGFGGHISTKRANIDMVKELQPRRFSGFCNPR